MPKTRALISSVMVGVASTALVLSALAPAQAASQGDLVSRVVRSGDPASRYAQLSAADQAQFRRLTTPGELVVSVTERPAQVVPRAARGVVPFCWDRTVSYTQKSLAHTNLFAHGQTTEVCLKSYPGNVYKVRVYSMWRQTYTPGWDYIDGHQETYNAKWEGRGMMQSHFRFSVAKIPAQNSYPCLQIRLNRDFEHSAVSHSCSVS